MLNYDQAQKIVAAALAAARELNLKPMSFVVLDARAALRAAATEDGAAIARWKVAYGKAHGAISLGVSSRALGTMALERPHFIGALASSVIDDGLVPVAGGVLIRDAAGAILGAAGASGDTSDNDEAALLTAIAAAGLSAA
jgi:uncharacterized protein GlcG (DUF336 family)